MKKTELLNELSSLHTQGVELIEPSDLSGSLRGRINLYNHIDFTMKNAEETVTFMTTAQGLLRKVEGLKPTLEMLAKRGVKIRIAAPLNTKEAKAAAAELKGIAEVRHIDHIKARFVIVDGQELIFMVMHDDEVHPTYDIGIWVNTPFFASALEQLFELAWSTLKVAVKK